MTVSPMAKGDLQRAAGHPISAMCDRATVSRHPYGESLLQL